MQYKEIFKLKEMLEKAGIPFEMSSFFDGYQIRYPSLKDDEYTVCLVIESRISYSSRCGDLLEIMGLLTDEEKETDEVVSCLTANNVFNRIKKHWEDKQGNENEFKNFKS